VSFTHVSRITSRCSTSNPKAHSIVDDGTGTIECAFRSDASEPESKTSEKQDVAPLARGLADKSGSTTEPHLVPVGSVVKVQGKVRARQNSKDVHGESLGPCSTMPPPIRIY
jgi:DNA/RNA endonuclease YhcR with UshA esterase domain